MLPHLIWQWCEIGGALLQGQERPLASRSKLCRYSTAMASTSRISPKLSRPSEARSSGITLPRSARLPRRSESSWHAPCLRDRQAAHIDGPTKNHPEGSSSWALLRGCWLV